MPYNYQYDAGDPPIKHKWSNPEAGFGDFRGRPVGKCPSRAVMNEAVAEALLNAGIGWSDPDIPGNHPEHIYNIDTSGVIYKATPTNSGRSYHGYPYKGDLPNSVYEKLLEVARTNGSEVSFRRWVDNYIDVL